jgi:predicted AlkP superfamily phosphohydrolase/phosphomutase/tetratricopeptide (TPR) repeat protein
MTQSTSSRKKVLLIGWDAADWKFINPLLDSGLLPNVERIVNTGIMANLASLRPCISPILWTSIATGKTADQHGITGFIEPVPGGGGVRLSSSASRTTKAIWNILSQEGLKSLVVNWYASHPAEPIHGTCISNRFFEGLPNWELDDGGMIADSVHPVELGPAICNLRMHPSEFALQDLDRFIPKIEEIDLSTDVRPKVLAETIAKTVSIHAVATATMENVAWDFAAIYFDGLDTAGHDFMQFHPPQMSTVSNRDFELYQGVMTELYRFHDEMLGRLLQLAGEDCTIILMSDHGFHCGHLRPQFNVGSITPNEQATHWHRHFGMLTAAGPELLRDERIYGANLLDITPTILAMYGLPIGRDMKGRPLVQAFQHTKEISWIDSWDNVSGNDGMQRTYVQQAVMQSSVALESLVAMGYLPAETLETQKSIDIATTESKFNLAVVYSSHGNQLEAQRILEELVRAHPENLRYAMGLAKSYSIQNKFQMSYQCLQQIESKGHRSTELDLHMSIVLFQMGKHSDSLERLQRIESDSMANPLVFRTKGDISIQLRDWESAITSYTECIKLDPDDAHALNGLSHAALQLRRYEDACEYALQAIGLVYFFPQAHYNLGMAFQSLGDMPRAIRSLDLATSQSPNFVLAHQALANLYQQSNKTMLWMKHHRMANGLPPLE